MQTWAEVTGLVMPGLSLLSTHLLTSPPALLPCLQVTHEGKRINWDK